MQIADHKIGSDVKPYLIAEMSNNHMRDIGKAYEIIEAAKNAGADAIKLQTYTADSLTIDCSKKDFLIPDKLWAGSTYYQLYSEITMPTDWNGLLFEKAKSVGITIFSSPFDDASVDLLEALGCPAYKIASFESRDPYFLKKVAGTKKPIILSTGVSNLNDIQESLNVLRACDSGPVAVLHCVSGYPSSTVDMNLAVLRKLQDLDCAAIGLSDHTRTNTAALLSVALGGRVIEKHFTLRRSDGGPDAAFSLEPHEFLKLRISIDEAFDAMGKSSAINEPRLGRHFARSLYFVKDLCAGTIISETDVRIIRPGFGLQPKYKDRVIGSKLAKDVEKGDRVTWEKILLSK